jgi:hypothetical protein
MMGRGEEEMRTEEERIGIEKRREQRRRRLGRKMGRLSLSEII